MNSHMQALVPTFAKRGDFVPVKGGYLNVALPGEEVRTEVLELISRDVCLVKIISVTLNKGGATQRTGDTVAVKRADNGLSETWVPVSEREVQEQEEREKAERFAKQEEERKAREEAERELAASRVAEGHPVHVTRVTEPERPAAARPRKKGAR